MNQKYYQQIVHLFKTKMEKRKQEEMCFIKIKKGIKVTTIVDNKGIPIEIQLNKGNRHDARIAPKIDKYYEKTIKIIYRIIIIGNIDNNIQKVLIK